MPKGSRAALGGSEEFFYLIDMFIPFLLRKLIIFFNVQGAGHNDVELYNQYVDRLKQFVSVELVN